jgi:hypothetical protein
MTQNEPTKVYPADVTCPKCGAKPGASCSKDRPHAHRERWALCKGLNALGRSERTKPR